LTDPPFTQNSSRYRLFWGLGLFLFVVVWFGTIGHRALFQTDEGRYAEIPREMLATGNWLTPRLDGFKYFEKPPLQYWATAASFVLFGEKTWSARLYTALTGLLTLLVLGWTGSRLWNRRVGWLAAAVGASSLYLVLMAHFNTLDMGVTFWMTLNLCSFLVAQSQPANVPRRRAYMYVSWVASALAVMSKGLIGVVFPGCVLLLYVFIRRDYALLRRLHYYGGLALFALFGVPWFFWVTVRNPEFFHYFFIYQHFDRYLDGVAHRPGPLWYFLPILLLGVLPWVREATRVLVSGWRRRLRPGAVGVDAEFLLWLYAVFIFVFFSLSSSKLPSYILPVMPALALLIGHELAGTHPSRLLVAGAVTAGIALLGMVATPLWIATIRPAEVAQVYARVEPWLFVIFGCLLLAAAAAGWLKRHGAGTVTLVMVLAAGWFIAISLINWSTQALDPIYSTRALARSLKPWNQPGRPFYIVGNYQQSLPFYLRRTLILVAWRGEIGYGIGLAQKAGHLNDRRFVPTLAAFHRIWLTHPQAVAILRKGLYSRLDRNGWPFAVVASNVRRVAVVHP
jgi:4-amino-4-deoxy-L-arabinose transferase-like glycosyltransferase